MIARLILVLLAATSMVAQTSAPPQKAAGYPIAGTIVNSITRQPLANVSVFINPTDDRQASQTVETGADGHFAFPALPAGKYSLTATTHGYRAQGINQHGNFFTGIAVGPGLDGGNVLFRLVPDAVIEGTIADDDGEPVRNASVQLFQRNNDTGQQRTQSISNAVIDDRGHYQFGHLPAGTYFVAVSARPWFANYNASGPPSPDPESASQLAGEKAQLDVAYALTFYPSTDDSTAATPLVLHPGDRATADIALHAVPAVHLRVKSGNSAGGNSGVGPPRGFPRVSQRIFEGTLVPVMSAQGFGYNAGSYEYTGIAPGRYVIEMTESGHRRGGAGWYKEMDLSGTVELDPHESPPLAAVSGAVMLEGGTQPSRNMNIVLINRNSQEEFGARVSDKGLFDFKDDEIRPGIYDVELANAHGFQVEKLLAKGAKTRGRTIEIAAGGNVEMVCTLTRAVAKVNGVVLRDDKPFAGAMVVLVPQDPSADWLLFRRDQSDSDGTFTLPQVLPGTYTVIALENGWDLDWASATVLQPYLKNGTPVEVANAGKLDVKVRLQ